mmetsp:Transcript_13448/g.34460  ORF Transcript_13448/g.34460 Transcript_13448/m.34460 type:complete len:384 (+) Transcript_13448:67-1218(+)
MEKASEVAPTPPLSDPAHVTTGLAPIIADLSLSEKLTSAPPAAAAALPGLAASLALVRNELLEQGYAVIDNALDEATTALLRNKMQVLHDNGGLRQHRFGFKPSASANAQIYTKPNIFEAESTDPVVKVLVPELLDTLCSLNVPRAASEAFPSLGLVDGQPPVGVEQKAAEADGVVIKLQCNEGGGACFPLHYDNAGPPSKRRLTCLFYLSNEWTAADGGELQLVPWLGTSVNVAPLSGRCALFLSDVVLHRVLPNYKRRFCFTIWLDAADATATNRPNDLRLDVRSITDVAMDLKLSPAQRLLSRTVYADEYAQSIRDCFELTPMQREVLLSSHTAHVDASLRNDVFARLAKQAQSGKPLSEAKEVSSEQETLASAAVATSQ